MSRYQSRSRRLARSLIRPINTAAIVIMGIYTTLWGFWLANPFWKVFTSARLYSKMAFLPEFFWGGLAIVVGLMMIYGVLRHSYLSLTAGAKVAALHWWLISIMYFWGDWRNTGGITSLMIAIYCAFIWLNIRINKDNLKL